MNRKTKDDKDVFTHTPNSQEDSRKRTFFKPPGWNNNEGNITVMENSVFGA